MSTDNPSSALAFRDSADTVEIPATPRDDASVAERPAISVVIPVRNDPRNLELCLQALDASEYPDYEIIVVDDASDDSTPEVAQRHDVQLLRSESRAGPAAARNRGARVARHPFLFFVDADVCVRPETLGLVAAKFIDDPNVDAFCGSYDARPGAPGFHSQSRNLMHHWVHQAGKEDASTFWSGCGAIRSSVFLDLGGFDTSYDSASVEDIELGGRLRGAGYRVELVKSLQVKHMKRWTLGLMIRTDVRNRGIPWTRLILRQGSIPDDLNLRHGQRLSALLSAGLPMTLAAALLDPVRIQVWLVLALVCLLGIVMINRRFYSFLARVKNPLFVARAIPFHVLYYLYSGLAFAIGLALHLVHSTRGPADP